MEDIDEKLDLTLSSSLRQPLFTFFLISTLVDIYSILSAMYWISVNSFPTEILLAIEILIEFYFIFNFLLRLALKNLKVKSQTHNLIKEYATDKKLAFIYSAITSFPFILLISIINSSHDLNMENGYYSFIFIFKLFRSIEIHTFIIRFQRTIIYSNFLYVVSFKLVENLLIMILLTHISSCFWLLSNKIEIQLGSNENFFSVNIPSSPFNEYIDSLVWGVSTMNGGSFGDIVPITTQEIIFSIIFMLIGATFYAKIFADFEKILFVKEKEIIEKKKMFEHAKSFCVAKKIPLNSKRKIKIFFTTSVNGFSEARYWNKLIDLPLSLQMEISLYLNEGMIKKVKLFKLGTPSFILAISKYLSPSICLAGDMIIRSGEIPEKFYIIKKGRVEIIATDNQTRIAILEEGAYFGEIAMLVTSLRSSNVKALTNCIFVCIDRENFLKIMELFPDQKSFLTNVAKQRLLTTTPEDLDDNIIINQEEHLDVHYSKLEKIRKFYGSTGNTSQSINKDVSSIQYSNSHIDSSNSYEPSNASGLIDASRNSSKISFAFNEGLTTIGDYFQDYFYNKFTILPFSKLYYFWFYVLITVLIFNLFYVTFSLFYGYNLSGGGLTFEFLSAFIYFIDIFFHSRTSIRNPNTNAFLDGRELTFHYLKNGEIIEDFISFVPLDIILYFLDINPTIVSVARIFRLWKVFRVKRLFRSIQNYTDKKYTYYRLFLLISVFIFLCHLWACIMFSVAKFEYETQSGDTMIKTIDRFLIVEERPFMKKVIMEIYLNFIYWALCASSTGVYGDIYAVTSGEKLIQMIGVLFFKFYIAFLAAEVTSIVSNMKSLSQNYSQKKMMFEVWCEHLGLPKNLHKRIMRFHYISVKKFRILESSPFYTELPQTLKDEILLTMLKDLIDNMRYFPKNDHGIILSIVRRLKIIIYPKDEYIFRSGELASEMYFVIEGKLHVIGDNSQILATLKKKDFFGEMGIIQGRASTRTAAVKALSDCSLAVFYLEDFNFITTKYPNVLHVILEIIEERKRRNMEKAVLRANSMILRPSILTSNINLNACDEHIETQRSQKRERLLKLSSIEVNQPQENSDPSSKERNSVTVEKNPNLLSINSNSGINKKNNQMKIDLSNSRSPLRLNSRQNSANFGNQNNPNYSSYEPKTPLSPYFYPATFRGNIDTEIRIPIANDYNSNSSLYDTKSNKNISMPSNIREVFLNFNRPSDPPDLSISEIQEFNNDENNTNEDSIVTINNWIDTLNHINNLHSEHSSLCDLDKGFVDNSKDKIKKTEITLFTFFSKKLRLNSKTVERLATIFKGVYVKAILNLYFVIIVPLEIAFDEIKLAGIYLSIAIIFEIILWGVFIEYYIRKYKKKSIKNSEKFPTMKERRLFFFSLYDSIWNLKFFVEFIFYMIPYYMIFDSTNEENKGVKVFLIALQFGRMIKFQDCVLIFKYLKIKYTAMGKVLEIILGYTLFCHFSACIFITSGNFFSDPSKTWLRKLPAPQPNYTEISDRNYDIHPGSKYIYALYWAYVTTSHIGFGDVSAINWIEKTVSCFIIFIGILVWVLFFGNIVSIIEDFNPIIKSTIRKKYKKIRVVLENIALNKFIVKFDQYFNYIWSHNKGINENDILTFLPDCLRVDVQYLRYTQCIQSSSLFFIDSRFNEPLTNSILKVMRYEIYLPEEPIIVAGQEAHCLFFMLEGEASIINFDLKFLKKLYPGSEKG